jgi:hypothetical protein
MLKASLRTEKAINKEPSSRRSIKDKAKSVKGKSTLVNTSCSYHKEHITNTESSRDKVEVVTFCQDLRLLSRSKIKELQLLRSEAAKLQLSQSKTVEP